MAECERIQLDTLSMLNHELRTPLTSIKGYANTLVHHDGQISESERLEFLLAIQQASSRIEDILEEIFQFQQLQSGSLTLVKSQTDLLQIIQQSFTVAEQRVQDMTGFITNEKSYSEQKGISFSVTVNGVQMQAATEGIFINADYQYLSLALSNLLENALLYSPQGGTIAVIIHDPASKERMDKALPHITHMAHMIEVCVCDNGVGIAQQHQAHIFDGFTRVDMSLTRTHNGLGLGLPITKRIIELHAGHIWVNSQEEKGCTFHILLPLM